MKTFLIALLSLMLCAAGHAQTTQEEWAAEAQKKHPDLAVAGSAFNKRFAEAHQKLAAGNPEFFKDPKWPMLLADELASGVPAAPPQTPKAQGSRYPELSDGIPVKITAQTVASGRKDNNSYNRDFNKQNKSSSSSQTVEITVVPEGFYGGTASVAVEWFFLGKDIKTNQTVIYGDGGQKAVCSRRAPAIIHANAATESKDRITTTSKTPISATTTLIRGKKEFEGANYKGWIVRAFDARGRIVGTAASQPEFLKHLQDIPLPE